MADKLPKMESCLEEWVLIAYTTARNLAKIRGKALHLSLGILHLRVLVPEISLTLGTESDPDDKEHGIDWDREITNTEGMLELGLEILRVILKGAPEGAEMWPPHQYAASSTQRPTARSRAPVRSVRPRDRARRQAHQRALSLQPARL
jgi:hypothetical protein